MTPTSRNLVRQINEQNVLQYVFNHGLIARTQIAKGLALNKVTVSDVVAGMLDDHVLVEVGEASASQRGGRKPVLLRFNAKRGYTVSFDVGFDHVDMMVNLLDGTIAHYQRIEAQGLSINQRLALMSAQLKRRSGFPDTEQGLLGIAVAVHAVVLDGVVSDSPFIQMGPTTVADYFASRVSVPVVIENEANLAALCERDFTDNAAANQVTISIHKGIGAGVIIDGKLYRGVDGRAGEIGRMVMPNHDGHLEKIETQCSEMAILDAARTALEDPSLDRAGFLARADAGDAAAQALLQRFCALIAVIVHNVANTYAPEQITLNSALIAARPRLLETITMQVAALKDNAVHLKLALDVEHAILLGGCALITHQVLGLGARNLKFRK